MSETDAYKREYSWNLDFAVNLGEIHKRFFEGLKDKKVEGNVCPNCGNVFIPPKPHCDECFTENTEWTVTNGRGVIDSYVVTFFQFRNMPEPPYVTGVIRVGDSETGMLHFVDGLEYDDGEELRQKVEAGMEVQPVWANERNGTIQDIEHFEPVP